MSLPPGFEISAMRREEVALLQGWAAAEGWNPGRSDLAVAWDCDPDAFVALRDRGDMVGGGSIFRHGPSYGFMGLFLMREDRRGRGLGRALWTWRRDRLLSRLDPGSRIGMDGVFHMVPFYEAGGFRPAYRHIRHQGIAAVHAPQGTEALGAEDLPKVLALDRACFECARDGFLSRWLGQPGAVCHVLRDGGRLRGFGMLRPAQEGFKFGPILAESPEAAGHILRDLSTSVAGAQIQIDLPEVNEAAVQLVETLGLAPVFGCQRLYLGQRPNLPIARIFAISSLEFG